MSHSCSALKCRQETSSKWQLTAAHGVGIHMCSRAASFCARACPAVQTVGLHRHGTGGAVLTALHAPVRRCAGAQARHCASAPVRRFSGVPVYDSTPAPLAQCTDDEPRMLLSFRFLSSCTSHVMHAMQAMPQQQLHPLRVSMRNTVAWTSACKAASAGLLPRWSAPSPVNCCQRTQ